MAGNTWAQESETVACSHGTREAGSLGLVVHFDINFNCFLHPTSSGKSNLLKNSILQNSAKREDNILKNSL